MFDVLTRKLKVPVGILQIPIIKMVLFDGKFAVLIGFLVIAS